MPIIEDKRNYGDSKFILIKEYLINKVHLHYKNQFMFIVCQEVIDSDQVQNTQDSLVTMYKLALSQTVGKELDLVLVIKNNFLIGCRKIWNKILLQVLILIILKLQNNLEQKDQLLASHINIIKKLQSLNKELLLFVKKEKAHRKLQTVNINDAYKILNSI